MSHPKAAQILEFLGFVPDRDFYCVGTPLAATITWLSLQAQPTDVEIDAAAADAQAEFDARAADAARKDQAKAAYSVLQQIIDIADTATTAQLRDAIKKLAQVDQHIIRGLWGR